VFKKNWIQTSDTVLYWLSFEDYSRMWNKKKWGIPGFATRAAFSG